ncbi:VanZ family protein [Mycoplasma sp. P36-A1]|uniref:VanZ family protein n=1 Tax=Mycoplasma sp. P36-A1 TaxID=3252900 RepID=UPI003C2C9FBB
MEFRRNGYFVVKEGFVFLSFIFYIEVAYFMTILPLPDITEMSDKLLPLTNYMQLDPLYFIKDISTYFAKHGFSVIGFFKAPPVYTTLFNVILLFPLGVYLKKLFNQPLSKIIVIAFLVSLSFELLQLSGLFFIYPYPYRLFDINDLMFNTLGAVIGALVANKLNFVFNPEKDQSAKSSYFQVTKFKQFVIYLADIAVIFVMSIFMNLIAALVVSAKHISSSDTYTSSNITTILASVVIIIFFTIPLFSKKYQTIAMKLSDTYLDTNNDNMIKRFLRTCIVYLPACFPMIFTSGNVNSVFSIIGLVYIIYFIIHMFIRKKGMFIIDRIFKYHLKREYDEEKLLIDV